MSRIKVAFVNESSVFTNEELSAIVGALQHQVDHDFRPWWGIAAEILMVPKGSKPPAGAFWIGVFDTSDQAGALGYHDLTLEGLPVGKVFAATDKEYGALVSVTCSHELLEMLADPVVNYTAMNPADGRLYALEVCDAVEADNLGYPVNGLQMSDFVLPRYFDPQMARKGESLSFCDHVTEPFSLAQGGYLSYIDLNNLGAGWQQETAQTEGGSGERAAGFPAGSRRDRRRRIWAGNPMISTVEASEPA